MAQTDKNGIIYLEVDEDITSAIDKLTKNTSDNIQIVTAKRSTLFQSVINMKLLKKAAADNGKVLTLVTSDRVATNLAARIGVPIAERVGEPGRVPSAAAPSHVVSDDEIDGGTVDAEEKPEPAKAPVKEAAAAAPVAAAAAKREPEPAAPAPEAKAAATSAAAKPAKASKSKIPNIGIMQKRVLWVAGGIFAILLLLGLNYYFTKANVTLFARGTQVNSAFKFTADPSAQSSDIDAAILAASQVSTTKNVKGSVTATGTKDNGTKAKGAMTVYNRTNGDQTLVAGTRFMAPDGKIFRSNSDVVVPKAFLQNFTPVAGSVKVDVTADQNGDNYNLGPARYRIPALGTDQVYGQGDQMSGGTSKTVKVITQADIDKAKQSALDADKSEAQKSLADKVKGEMVLLDASIQQNATKVDPNPEANSEAQSGSVSVEVTYTALAVRKSELSAITKAQEQKQIGQDKEIYEDGSDQLALTPEGKPDSSGALKFSAKATAFAGAKIDKEQLAKEIKGKKLGDAVEIANQQPEIEKSEIKLSPSWATSLPNILKHITIEIKVSNQ